MLGVGGTAAGLSPADLIGVMAIVVSLFGLLLTAIGVLVLVVLRSLGDRVTELKTDTAADFASIWHAIEGLRLDRMGVPRPGGRRSTDPPASV